MADSGENNVAISSSFTSKLMKWRVNEGQDVKERTVLALYEKVGQSSDQKGFNLQPKLRSNVNGRIKKLLVAEGDVVPPGKPVIQIEQSVPCEHTTVMKDLCCDCGMDLRKLSSDQDEPSSPTLATVSMIHNIPELRVTQDEAEAVGKKDEERLLNTRKLALVVDLDQTMIHTTIELVPSDMKDVYHFNLSGYPLWYHTKFRPFYHEFLKKISKLYELHIFTMGSRMYAHTIARMLDPDEGLFGHRIRSRDDCFNAFSKSNDLRSLFPRGDSMVCIIDDRTDVWNNAPNLIKVKPYQFFKGVGDINAPSDKQLENTDSKSDEKMENKEERDDRAEDTHKGKQNIKKEDIQDEVNRSEEQSDSKDGIENNTDNDLKENEECKADNFSHGDNPADYDTKENMGTCCSDIESKSNEGTYQLVNNVKNGKSSSKDFRKESCNFSTGAESSLGSDMMEVKSTAANVESETSKQVNHTSEESTQNDEETTNSTLSSNNVTRNNYSRKIQNEDHAATKSRSKELCNESLKNSVDEDSVHEKDTQDTSMYNNNNGGDNKENKNEERENTKEKPSEEAKTAIVKEKDNPTSETSDVTTKHDHVDEDDYLVHLEEILRRIHDRFYNTVDQIKELKAKGIKEADSTIARYCSPGTLSPCTKQIIKELQYEVLKGAKIVFTGVIPTNIPPEKSDIWQRSERLGAKVSRNLVTPKDARDASDVTTHVIAARLGTEKTYHAIKTPGIKIVKPDWLLCCEERWEWVDERLFAVEGMDKYKRETRSQRTPQGTPHHWKKVAKTENSPEALKVRSDEEVITKDETMRERTCSSSSADLLMASLNPLLSFSSTEMEAMDKEVEELMNSDADDEAESDVIGSISGSSSSSNGSSSSSSSSSSSPSSDNENGDAADVTKKRKVIDSDSEDNTSKKRKEEHIQSDDESDDYTRRSSPSDDDDDDGDDDMAALLEAELTHD